MKLFKNEFIRKNLIFIVLFLLGGIMLSTYLLINSTYVIPGSQRLVKYISLLLIFLSLFLILIKNKRVILANVILFVSLIIIIELACFFMLGMPDAVNKNFELVEAPEEHISTHMGIVPYADSVHNDILIKDNDTVFNVKYSIDKNCLRITPDHKPERNKYALFFGCSLAFGQGLNNDETLPYQFQVESDEYNSYNFAYSGYGTNHMLARLQYQNLSENVAEKDGAAFYIFFWDHIYRSIGSMNHYCDWMSSAPYFAFEGDQLIRKRKFKDGRYFTSKFYELVYQTNIVKKFKIGFPTKLNEHHYDLVTEMILESKKTYEKQFGNDRFYLVFYPSYVNYTTEQLNQFKAMLKSKNIDFIDMYDFINYGPEHTLGGDPHPNAITTKNISKELLKRIN